MTRELTEQEKNLKAQRDEPAARCMGYDSERS